MNTQTEQKAALAAEECWSVDEENFKARTLCELIDNHDLAAGTVVFRAEALHPAAKELIDVEDIVETMSDRAYNIAGEYAEGYPDISKDAAQELTDFLAGWIAKHAAPTFYTVKNVQHYTITEADVAPSAE